MKESFCNQWATMVFEFVRGEEGGGKNLNFFLGRRNPKGEIVFLVRATIENTMFHTNNMGNPTMSSVLVSVSLQVPKHGLFSGDLRVS